MKRYTLAILLLLQSFQFMSSCFGQSLRPEDIIGIAKLTFSDLETYLLKRGYTMEKTESDSIKSFIEYRNGKTDDIVRATKYRGNLINDIEYTTSKKADLIRAKEFVKLKKYKPEGTKIEKGKVSVVTSIYTLDKITFWLYSFSAKSETDESMVDWYRIQVSIFK